MILACGGTPATTDGGTDAGADAFVLDAGADSGVPLMPAHCEPLSPLVCGLPFPSSFFLEPDATTETGYRLAVGPILRNRRGPISAEALSARDGFSVNAALLAHLPHATAQGLPRSNSIERSLEASSPTVILDTVTGERVAHFADIDASTMNNPDGPALVIQPIRPLVHARRYIVAVRGLVDESGSEIAPSQVFAALRDGSSHPEPYVARRRAEFEDIFGRLETAGVARGQLQLAWDFVTSSLAADTAWVVSMRDRALAMVGADGPEYTVERVEEAPSPGVLRRIHLQMTVPLFLDQAEPGGVHVFGDDGLPRVNGTASYPVLVIVPARATPDAPVTPLQVGHGLFGNRFYAQAFEEFGQDNGYVLFATDWIGMSDEDVDEVVLMLSTGAIDRFSIIPDRVAQGVVNALLAMRMMIGRFARDPLVNVGGRPLIDPTERYYYGGSQGGIYGATYMALTTDVERGVLAVPGQPYNLLLPRSVDFDAYAALLRGPFPRGTDQMLMLAWLQQLWDRVDPGSYSEHIRTGALAGGHAHEVMMAVAIGDHQVTTLGAHIMARAAGIPSLRPVNRSIFDVEEADAPHTGSFMVEVDFGLTEPVDNVPVREGQDPHGRVGTPPIEAMADELLRTGGVAANVCSDTCDPE